MADKQVIVEIQYDTDTAKKDLSSFTSEANKKVSALTDEVFDLTEANKRLGKEIKNVKGASEQDIKIKKQLNREIQVNKERIKDANKERTKTIMDLKGEKTAFEKLTESIEENNKENKKQGAMLSDIGDKMNALPGPIGGVVNGIRGMTKSALAFIATPIGAVIAAIALALGALMKYLKGSEEGQDKLNKMMSIFDTIMGNLSDIVQKVGKAIFEAVENPKQAVKDLGNLIKENLLNRFKAFGKIGKAVVKVFSKDWKEGLKDLANATSQLATGVEDPLDKALDFAKELNEEMKKEVAISSSLADRQAALNKMERSFLKEKSRLQRDIAVLRTEAADKTNKSDKERVAALKKAISLEEQILKTDIKIAKEKAAIKAAQNSLSNSTKEDLDEQAALEAQVFNIEKQNIQKRKSLVSGLSTLENKIAKEKEKRNEKTDKEDEKRLEKEIERRGKAIYEREKLQQQMLLMQAKTLKEELEIKKELANQELEQKLEQDGILKEEIELAEEEHKLRMLDIEMQYLEQKKMMEQEARVQAQESMQAVINATNGFADQRVSILSDVFSKISTLDLKEEQSSLDKISAIGQAAQGLTGLIVAGNQRELADMEAQKQAELKLAGDDKEAKANIERKYQKKLVSLKKQQFKEEKAKAIVDAALQAALGIVKTIGSVGFPAAIPLIAAQGVIAGASIATIASQKPPKFSSDQVFAKGGIIGGKPHSMGGTKYYGDDGNVFEAERDELMFVLNKDATAEIAALSKINEPYVGRSFSSQPAKKYQEGGQVDTTDKGFNVDIERAISEGFRNAPAPVVRVSDIEMGMTDFNNVKKTGVV